MKQLYKKTIPESTGITGAKHLCFRESRQTGAEFREIGTGSAPISRSSVKCHYLKMKQEYISIKIERNKLRKFFVNEIIYCKADNSYTTIKMIDEKEFVICKSLKEIEKLLSKYTFFRINRSCLVNMNHCIELTSGRNPEIILVNDEKLIPHKKNLKIIQEMMLPT